MSSMDESRRKLKQALENWIICRQNAKKELHALADTIDVHSRNGKIATVTGTSAALVGTGLTIAGVIAAPFTLGASVVLCAVGAGVGVLGAGTAVGTAITDNSLQKQTYQKAKESLDNDNESTKNVQKQIKSFQNKLGMLKTKDPLSVSSFTEHVLRQGALAKATHGFVRAVDVAVDAMDDLNVLKALGRSAGTAATRLTKVAFLLQSAGALIGAALIPFNVKKLAEDSYDIHTNSPSELGKALRKSADELECPRSEKIDKLLDVYIEELEMEEEFDVELH